MSGVSARTGSFVAVGASLLIISAFWTTGCLNNRVVRDCQVCCIEIGEWDDDPFESKAQGVVYTRIDSKEGVEEVKSLLNAGEKNPGFYALVGYLAHLRLIGVDGKVKRIIAIHADGIIVKVRSGADVEYEPFINPRLNQYVFEILLSAAPGTIEQKEQQWVDLTGTNYIRDVFYPDVYRSR